LLTRRLIRRPRRRLLRTRKLPVMPRRLNDWLNVKLRRPQKKEILLRIQMTPALTNSGTTK